MVVALRTDHDVDGRRAANDLLAFGLRNAACDRNFHVAPLARGVVLHHAQPPELGIDLFRGLLADMAGVEDHQIRFVGVCRLDKTLAGQRIHHALRIVDIHLAAIGFDVQLARRRHGTCLGGKERIGAQGSNIA